VLGNVKPYMPALNNEGKTKYGAYYCGLCKALGHSHGLLSRFMLNYDMAFVAVIYSGLKNEQYSVKHTGCFANPFRRKDILVSSESTAYAADVLIMLAHFKLKDNIADENFGKKAAACLLYPYMAIKYRRVAKRHTALAAILEKETANQFRLEKQSDDIDRLAMPTANMVKAILQECAPAEKQRAVGQFGFFLGRVIYLLDALCDREEDKKGNKFNIFNIKAVTDEDAKAECFMALGEMAYWYRQSDIKENKEIADNIIYISLARKIKFAGEERNEATENGQ